MQRTIGRSRILLVLLMAFGLVLGSVAAPAAATGDGDGEGDNVDSVRAQTIGTIDYKTGLLTDLKNGTDNADRKAVYEDGIAQLAMLRASAADSGDIEQLRSMDAQAHAIYHDTKARASAVGQTEEEKIAEVRKAALDTINYKLSIFREAKGKTDNPAHKEIYADAISQLEALKAAAEGTESIADLKELKSQAHRIYDATKAKIGDAGGDKADEGKKEEKKEPEKTEAQKAAEALAKAKRSTLGLIDHKISILTHGAEAAKNPAVAAHYTEAAAAIAELTDAAKDATSIKALKDIDAQIMEIYESTKAAVAESHGKPEWQPSEAIKGYLDGIDAAMAHLVSVAKSNADASPDTAAAVAKAGAKVADKTDAARAACESGDKLDSKWSDLEESVHAFRKALREHMVAVTGGPAYLSGWHYPG